MTGSLASVHPELIPEWSEKNLPLTPDKITFGSNKRVWWKGACGHEWETSVKARSKGEKCPICSGARVIEGINDLATLKPLLAQEWSEKNELKPTEVSVASHKKIIWKCKHGHEWEASVKSRTVNGTGCPYCSHNKVLAGFNDLASQYPDIAAEWSDRNLPLQPTMVTAFANSKAWWKCRDCGNEWYTLISTRSGGSRCPYCSGYTLLKGFNDLATTHPDLAAEWSERNYPLLPDEVNAKSRRNVWWKCKTCGNEWKSVINARVKGTVCPVCADRAVLAGYNDLATTDRKLLAEWDYATRTEYIKGIFNNDYTQLPLSNGRLVGYKTFQNVLHLWEGEYENRTAQSFYDWGVIAQHFEAMRLLGELTDTMKPLPSMDGQLTLIMGNQAEKQKTSAFTFSQEIIDAVLTRGSGVSEGKMRIYEQFEKSLSAKENADFLKNEYGWGGSYPVIIGAGIDEQHDGKGITISKGIGSDKPHITLSWSQVEKRIGDLIRMDRYLNPKEKEQYPEWLEKQEERRAELAEQRKNREILSTAPPEPENKEDEPEAQYEYHLGDSVYIGASQYEILSFDENRVMLYDFDMPLFNKELSREEFDRKVRENPMNDHLKVSVLPAEEKTVTGENETQNDTETVQDFSPKTGYDDAFFIDRYNESVTWMYYNPDSNAGGQYVTNTLSFDEIQQAAREYDSTEDFFDYLGSIANQELADVGTEWFEDADREFHRTPDLTDCTSATMETLIKNAERADMVATNIGNVPIEDYREIVATQNGFDSYEEMYNEGVRIGNGYDKEPEPIVPAWEQKKKSKVKSFDLHPDIPMSERHNFDLANNQVEEVNKKERFHRNYAAIKVLKDCQNENRFATPDEQKILSRYVGWGGIPEAFDERAGAWHTEYAMLKNILTPEEYASARESTLTAFYTPPEVSTAIYKVLEQMGFQEGNLLEPSCGIGNFIGMLPKSMENAKVYGVELDTISAGIAQQLYQKSSIAAQGFEEVNVPDSFFDGVIGNVPFGDFKVSDKRYDKYNFLIHDYFFAKSLDKLRPGGVMALVTSKGTMDKENSNVRKYIAQRAELLGAIRLPNDTFKGNAGTEVVSDILFLQKRDRLIDIEPDWVHLDTDENGIRMNSYFVQHPEMILGEMKMVSGRFGPEATCEPFENADLSELLNEAVSNIHGEISEYEVADELEEEDNSIPADPTVRNFSYTILDDKIYFRENSRMSPVEVSATAENRIKGMIGIRDCVRNLIELQTEDYPDSEIKQAQEKLNTLYDSFTKKYGLINSRANTSAFSDDSSYALLSALEVLDENGELERKADMFFKRTIKPHKPVTEVDTADEALAVSMGEKAAIDMAYMMELSGKSEEELFSDLKGVIFLNPLYEYGNSYEPKYLMADEYLSGNVREKLATAKSSPVRL